jgi:hypothetical protein
MLNESVVVDDCWLWEGTLPRKGYGTLTIKGELLLLHRVSFELFKGPVPVECEIDHTCHNADQACPGGETCRHRRCWRPEHLDAVAHTVNIRRSSRACFPEDVRALGRAASIAKARTKTHCKNGHELTPENTFMRNGARECRECGRIARRKWEAEKRRRPRRNVLT